MESGRVAARILDTAEASQLALAAAVHVRAPMQRLLDDTPALWALMGVEAPLQSGAFSEPPRLEDLAALAFDPRDLEGVRDCEAQDCGLKLDEAGLHRVREVEWRSLGARARFSGLLREWMLGVLVSYRRDGALPIYLDKKRPVSVAEEIARSVGESAYVDARSPFLEYVLGYPKAALPDTCDSFYWSTEKLSKPVTSLHHLLLHRGPDVGVVRYAIADKHLSDTHYFRSRLELLWLLEGTSPGDFYCVRLSLARVDPPGWLKTLVMGKVKRATRNALEANLDRVRRHLEAAQVSNSCSEALPEHLRTLRR
ncbi:MAG: hypothetical protein ACHP85_06545 [Burkholderiales bacterium]